MPNELRNFLALSYERTGRPESGSEGAAPDRVPMGKIQEKRPEVTSPMRSGIKAVTVLFSDLEGRLHMLDYDKKFLIKSWDNLTFGRFLDSRLHGAARKRSAPGH